MESTNNRRFNPLESYLTSLILPRLSSDPLSGPVTSSRVRTRAAVEQLTAPPAITMSKQSLVTEAVTPAPEPLKIVEPAPEPVKKNQGC